MMLWHAIGLVKSEKKALSNFQSQIFRNCFDFAFLRYVIGPEKLHQFPTNQIQT